MYRKLHGSGLDENQTTSLMQKTKDHTYLEHVQSETEMYNYQTISKRSELYVAKYFPTGNREGKYR
ncbi:hypothetical protein BVRB_2g045270 [Beta vulgaris subsp. vulgaris]|uniref:Uncharacterized protein n=1 Tax=Beta vulgaris subsp. vulgaris TaxID=3555 RepID=A0A0J8BDI1_BETVV|nr:hypothetical protein BVRB_2g045270 [Beta vulgaris subsp. vulgaris]